MSKPKIVYYDLAIGAAMGAQVSVDHSTYFSAPSLLPFGNTQKNVAMLVQNGWTLEKTTKIFENNGEFNIPYCSLWASNEESVPHPGDKITMKLDDLYTSFGITFIFDSYLEHYPKELNIIWKAKGVQLASKNFFPNAPVYFCENLVEGYDEIIVTVLKTNLPNRFTRINRIMFGIIRTFDENEIKEANIHVDGDAISNTLSTSTVHWTVDSQKDVPFIFQKKQPVYTYLDEKLLNVTYISNSKQISDTVYQIENEDVLGLLEAGVFPGQIFNGEGLKETIEALLLNRYDIFVDKDLESEKLYGYIGKCSRREALRQICFSVGACATTFRTNGLRIIKVLDSAPTVLKPDEVFRGQQLEVQSKVTKVVVYSHELKQDNNGSVEIAGVKYTDVSTPHEKVNPDIGAYDIANVVEINNMTLVSLSNIDKVLDFAYNYFVENNEMNATVILGQHDIGENITVPTNWNKEVTGNISSMEIRLSNLTVADVKTRGL